MSSSVLDLFVGSPCISVEEIEAKLNFGMPCSRETQGEASLLTYHLNLGASVSLTEHLVYLSNMIVASRATIHELRKDCVFQVLVYLDVNRTEGKPYGVTLSPEVIGAMLDCGMNFVISCGEESTC